VPIRVRLSLGFAVAALVIFGVSAVLFERSFRHGAESGLDPGLRAQATAIARSLPADGGGVGLQGNEAGPSVATRDVVAQVLDARGRVVDATREAGDTPVIGPGVVLEARNDTVITDGRVGKEGEHFRLLVKPVDTPAGLRLVVAGAELEPADNAVRRVREALVVGGIAVVAVAGAGAWVLAGAALRPVERMRRKAAELSEHDVASRLPVPRTRDELAALGSTMNELLERLQHALQVQRDFVADAGHELRTPLAVLRTELELAARRPRTPEELRATIDAAQAETERIARLTEELLFLAHADEDHRLAPRETQSIVPLVTRSLDQLRPQAQARGVQLDLDAGAEVRAPVAPDLLRRAVENLVENALRYAPDGSRITTRVHRDDGHAVVQVVDEGGGFPPEFLPRAFERFRRADDARSREDGGTGLGLAIVQAVARAHGGTAEAGNRPDGGAVVTLRLPVTDA
jgi:two-component system OmpR family sensor kinase